MIELFRSGDSTGWLVLGSAWAVQIALLVIAILGQKKWQWALMFTVQILTCIGVFALFSAYNNSGPRYFLDFSTLDDTLITLLAGFLFCITLFVSWVFWMNRKAR